MRPSFLLSLAAVASVDAKPVIDPAHATNITVFHVNPHSAGAYPVNMDTANAAGDLFFDLFEVLITPLACAQGSSQGHSCSNPEAVGKDLVVNKLVLEVDNRYSDYAMCNIGVNGTDGHRHKCTDGTYCCFCHEGWYEKPCQQTLGREDLKSHWGGGGSSHHHHHGCREGDSSSECYERAVFSKLASTSLTPYWYSSLASGYCDAPGAAGNTTCTWRVVAVEKIISRECHTRVFGGIVQATRPASACLDACGSQATNVSSACWTDCFYKAAVGPDSATPGGQVGGMSLTALTAAWQKPFAPEAEGGCPALKQTSPWFVEAGWPKLTR